MSEITRYVAYYVAPQNKGLPRQHLSLQTEGEVTTRAEAQQLAVQEFVQSRKPTAELIETFVEIPDNRRGAKWPLLQKALEACKRQHATLLIAELGTLASNEHFAQLLLESMVTFHCLDQPFVNQTILEALSKHAQVQRKLHGKLIREGLKMTSAKSGNPNAAEVISKVNKPKIDTAIVFACLLQPIIQDYRRNGYSQRQMVKTLNDEGFTAPEGGKWVLSQLQKVLDRVRLNEIANETKSALPGQSIAKLSMIELTDILNSRGIVSMKRTPWDETQIKKLKDRIQQIEDIVLLNRFVLDLLPLLHRFRNQGLSSLDILKAFESAAIPIRHDLSLEGKENTLADKELRPLMEKLKIDLKAFPEKTGFLDMALESAAKHIPAYLKIVKGHIDQLAKVLDLETHSHRNLESVGLAEPVQQLIQLFRELDDEDLQLLETLSFEAHAWQTQLERQATAKEAEVESL